MTSPPRSFLIGVSWSDSPVSLHFRSLARELAARGHRVALVVDGQRTDLVDRGSNPQIHTWPSRRPVGWSDARFLAQLIQQQKPDCVIGNFSAVNLFTLVGWWHRVPRRVMWYHTLSTQQAFDAQGSSFLAGLQNWRKRWIYSLATHLMANSVASRNDLHACYGVPERKLHVTYFSLPDPLTSPTVRAAIEVAQLRPTVLCVGRLDYSKGQDVLLAAFQKVLAAVPHAQLSFMGDGPQRGALEQQAQALGLGEHCRFWGRLPHADVLVAMAAAMVTVVPSRAEAFGLVNVESFAVGTPVIASRTGGIPEIYSDEREGWLVPPGDPAPLAAALLAALTEPEVRAEKSLQARQRFLNTFDAALVIPAQADWFESLVASVPQSN